MNNRCHGDNYSGWIYWVLSLWEFNPSIIKKTNELWIHQPLWSIDNSMAAVRHPRHVKWFVRHDCHTWVRMMVGDSLEPVCPIEIILPTIRTDFIPTSCHLNCVDAFLYDFKDWVGDKLVYCLVQYCLVVDSVCLIYDIPQHNII